MSSQPSPTSAVEGTALARNRLGIAGVVFFVVAASAPLVGMTGAVPVAIVLGNGAGVPGAYLAVGLVLLVFAVGFGAMSSKVSNSGAFFAYVGRGLGIGPGVGSAFVSLLAYITVQLAIYGFFGNLATVMLNPLLGISLPWWVWTFITWVLVLGLSLLQVDIGAKVLGVLMLLEVISLFIVAFVVLGQGGAEGLDWAASFSPAAVFEGGFTGTAGIALAFAFASYIGFEATAIYGEETKNPKRAVPLATYIAVGLITVLFTLTSFAMISGLGASGIVDSVLEVSGGLADPSAVLFTVASDYVGPWLSVLMGWLVLTSLFAGLLAFQNNAARYFFSMGRAGVLPTSLDKVNKRQAPARGTLVMSAITLVVMAAFAIAGADPFLHLFSWMSAVAVMAIIVVEILVSVAVIVFFRRHRDEGGLWSTMIAPILAIIGLLAGLYLIMARFNLLAGTAADGVDPSLPESGFALSGLGWFLVLLPLILLAVGWILGAVRKGSENRQAVEDLVS